MVKCHHNRNLSITKLYTKSKIRTKKPKYNYWLKVQLILILWEDCIIATFNVYMRFLFYHNFEKNHFYPQALKFIIVVPSSSILKNNRSVNKISIKCQIPDFRQIQSCLIIVFTNRPWTDNYNSFYMLKIK